MLVVSVREEYRKVAKEKWIREFDDTGNAHVTKCK
jgi:hypothetical protein